MCHALDDTLFLKQAQAGIEKESKGSFLIGLST
jgi:hypothetical protein